MKRIPCSLSRHIVPLAILLAASSAAGAVQTIAWYRLGDDDPGAAPGGVGNNPTLDHTANHFDLTRAGSPHYSADVPRNAPTAASSSIGSDKLSMQFLNYTGPLMMPQPMPNYYSRVTSVIAPTATIGLECWVKSSPIGQNSTGDYALIAYNGSPLLSGAGFFQRGKNYVVRIGQSYEKVLAPASSTTWTHLGFIRNATTNSFYVNGIEQPDASAAAQVAPAFNGGSFYVAGLGNPLSPLTVMPRYLFSGLVDEARFFSLPTVASAPAGELLIANIPRDLTWAGAAGNASWNTVQSNWRGADQNAAAWCNTAPDNARFGAGAASASINVAAPATVGSITFDANAPVYTLYGSAITIEAPLGLGMSANRSAAIHSPVNLANDQDWNVADGQALTLSAPLTGLALNKQGSGTLTLAATDNGGVNVSTGTVQIETGQTVRTAAVAVAPGAKLDLQDGRMIVSGGDIGVWNGSAYTGIQGLIASGRNSGAWNGSGIATSRSDAGPSQALTTLASAKADDIDFVGRTIGGFPIVGGDVLVMYTRAGDANLDGFIDADDYFAIDSNYNKPATPAYWRGDFNYNGRVDGDDYFIIDSNLSSQPAGSVAAVPEGSTVGGALLLIRGLRRRRRAG